MDEENTPIYGCTQPTHGGNSNLFLDEVARRKSSKIVSRQARKGREAVGRNFLAILAKAFPGRTTNYGYTQIEQDTGIVLATLQRIAKGQTGATIDTLSDIAHNLGCTLSDLTAESKEGQIESPNPQRVQRRHTD